MSKKNIRLLASGFLFSGLLIVVFNLFGSSETAASNTDDAEALESEIQYLEEVAVSLELENEQLSAEISLLTQELESDENSEVEIEESDESNEPDSLDELDEDADTEEEVEEVTEYTVVVNEGDPSSVVATQLENYGLIDDYHGFNQYMEDNNLFRQLRPGDFTVRADMTREQLIDAIIR